ncbi:ABC transporter permease [Lacisediminimonas sp.]|uniref:ABC transporter permease n=1 Tax=Lacisediminimonas sp. TaxID=3060582 RepID=UPI00271CA012|nr:ABC transporter permease [Lacisediminimonas sp.]MDO8298993.1 ABC transporter permease [Lacisediminimonas sp.]
MSTAIKPDAPAPARPSGTRQALRRITTMVVPWATLIGIWYLIKFSGLVESQLLPTPAAVLSQFWVSLTTERLWVDMMLSTRRVALGLLFGMMLAVPVGFLVGWYRPVRRFVDPLINFFRALPPIALIPLVIVYLGIGEVARVSILFYASFFAAVIVMYEGMAQISPVYIRVSRTLGATDAEIFFNVMVPLTVPHMLTALRVALGVSWATLVASELVAAQNGLGARIQTASNFFNLEVIYMGIICIGAIALLMDMLLRAVSRRMLAWQDRLNEGAEA